MGKKKLNFKVSSIKHKLSEFLFVSFHGLLYLCLENSPTRLNWQILYKSCDIDKCLVEQHLKILN